MNFKVNFKKIFKVNFLTLIVGILSGFLIPLVLTEYESYSNYKTYMLFIGYIGVLHFGFIDGLYLKYGGKKWEEIDLSELKFEHRTLVISETLISLICLSFAILFKSEIFFLFSLSIIPINLFSFYKFLYQATGEFTKFEKISLIYVIFEFFLLVSSVVLFKFDNYIFYIMNILIINIFVVIVLELKMYKLMKNVKAKKNLDVLLNFKVGIYVMLGNFAVILLYGIDKIFVKIFFDSYYFAQYSFAISMLNIVMVLISSVSLVFYNYLFNVDNKKTLTKIKTFLLIIGTGAVSGYFMLRVIIEKILPTYSEALEIIGVSFVAYPFILVINILFLNLYKVEKKEKKYLCSVIGVLVISVILNTLFLYLGKDIICITIATLITYIIWYIVASLEFKFLKLNKKDILYIIVCIICFFAFKEIDSSIIGGSFYIIAICVLSIICYRKEILSIVKNDINII